MRRSCTFLKGSAPRLFYGPYIGVKNMLNIVTFHGLRRRIHLVATIMNAQRWYDKSMSVGGVGPLVATAIFKSYTSQQESLDTMAHLLLWTKIQWRFRSLLNCSAESSQEERLPLKRLRTPTIAERIRISTFQKNT